MAGNRQAHFMRTDAALCLRSMHGKPHDRNSARSHNLWHLVDQLCDFNEDVAYTNRY